MILGLLAGAGLGMAAFFLFGDDPRLDWVLRNVSEPIGQVFLRLLFALVVPLIFSALVLGVTALGDVRSLGRIGAKTLAYTIVVSTIAVLLGLALVNLLEPGAGISPEARERLAAGASDRAAKVAGATAPKTGVDLLVQIVPDNPVRAMAQGDMLAVMFFAIFFGVGLALTRSEAARNLELGIQGLYDVTMRLIGFVIALAPFGVAALLLVVVLALAVHQFVVYSLAVRLLGGMSPLRFFRGIQEAMITAFSTASSNATLPTALKVANEELRLPAHVSRFVLTVGSTANQNGTALFEGVTVLFLAQFYGVELSLARQVLVLLVCILGGIGTAGVPAGSLPVVALILGMVGVPVEGIGLILGVDRFLDMCRTTLNVSGDLAAAVVISRGESGYS
jgi:DAACS family dicarboxylate/amino acid:cation (Na+ or H+) symporter